MKRVYCLLLNVKKNINVKVGALGTINFKKGEYAYVGSGQNNVEKRIARHVSENKKLRWHIDYLFANPNAELKNAVYKKGTKEVECKMACLLSLTEEPVKGFGCSDCDCYSHLFRLNLLKGFENLAQ